MRVGILGFLLALALGSSPRLISAQSCAGPNEFSNDALGYLMTMATSMYWSHIRTREAQGIPAALESEVTVVTDSAVCATAASAYATAERDTALTGGRQPQPGDSTLGVVVYVFRVKDRYVVVDEQNAAGEFSIAWVFDLTFATPLKRLAL